MVDGAWWIGRNYGAEMTLNPKRQRTRTEFTHLYLGMYPPIVTVSFVVDLSIPGKDEETESIVGFHPIGLLFVPNTLCHNY
jgi:hypothetical protein